MAEPPDPDDPLLAFVPYLHKAPRGNSITPDRQRAFIATLAATGIVTQAARRIGASLEALYRLRHQPGAEGFARAWEQAIERGVTRLEDCALELALRGEELPIVSAGKLLGTYRKHNFGHIRFILSQRRPGRYGPVAARRQDRWDGDDMTEQEVLDSIDAMIDQMREREAANRLLLEHEDVEDDAEDGADDAEDGADG